MGDPAALKGVPVLAPRGLNVSIYLDINRFARRTAWAHGFMHDYALWLGLVVVTLVFLGAYAVLWWRRRVPGAAALVLGGAATVAALGLNQLVGHAARELRPYDTLPHVLVLVGKANDYAFPSDHSVVAGGLVASIALVLWRLRARRAETEGGHGSAQAGRPIAVLGAVAAAFGLFLCFARIYVGAHYPGDVVAGFLLGAAVVGVASLLRPVAEVLAALMLRTPLAILLRRPWPAGNAPAQGHEGTRDGTAGGERRRSLG